MSDTERELVAALLTEPEQHLHVTGIDRYDFADPRLGLIFETLCVLLQDPDCGESPVSDLSHELDANGDLERVGGQAFLAGILDAWPGPIPIEPLVTRIKVDRHKREQKLLLERAVEGLENGGLQSDAMDRLSWLSEEIDALQEGRPSKTKHNPSPYVFTGEDRFEEIQSEPQPAWIVDPMLLEGTVTLLGGPPFTGKTRFAVWVSMCQAAGIAPWEGASTRAPAPVIYIGYDTHASARTLRSTVYTLSAAIPTEQGAQRLSLRHDHGYQERLALVGSSRIGGAFPVERYRLDEAGIANLQADLFALVESYCGEKPLTAVIDTFSTALPLGVDENDNPALNAILARLGGLATELGMAIMLLHHPKKGSGGKDFDPDDPESYFRGASSMVGAVGIAAGLWAPRDEPRHRALTRWTNYGGMQRTWFEVCSEERAEGRWIDYWTEVDSPAKQADARVAMTVAGEILELHEEINMTTLQERLVEMGFVSSKRSAIRHGASLRARWEASGDIEVRQGPRNAILIRRIA